MTKNKKEMIIVTMLTITAIAILGAVSTINVNGLSKCESDLNAPKTIYVGGAGAGNYSTIQEGITVASEADIVFVYSGTYYENVVIDKTITLIGEDRNTTIIDGNGTGDVVYISADWVNVSGFGVRGSGSANIHPNFDAGIEIRSSSNTVTDCTCYNNHYGIYLYYSSNNNITTSVAYNNSYSIYLWYSSNNVITANQIYNNEHGIELWYSSNNILRDNILENNTYNFCVYGIYGADISYFYQDIDTSNTINDKAVYYIIGQNDILFDGIDVGYLALVSCRNIQVKNLKLTNNRQGLLLINTSHSTIISNYIYNNSWGIDLGYSSTNNITANQIYNNSWGIYLCTSPNNNITTNQIYNNSCGIDLKYSSNNNIITSNQIYNNLEGITPSSSSNNNISSNQIYNNKIYGIWLTSSSSNHITANQIYNNFNGIYLYSSSNTNISLNNIYNNDDNAVYLVSSSNNYLGSNNIYNNDYGISLDESSNNIMQNNTLENNTYNFGVYGVGLSDFYQDIDISNMINSKPIYYMVEQSHLVFDGIEVGYLGLVSCNNLLVKNLTLANNINGLLLANTSYSTVTSNQIYNNSEEGICLRYSTNNNKITANQIYNNYYGIYLWYSSNNNITINLIYNNSNDGIYLEHSSNNNITSNQIYDNSDDGIFLDLSSNNEIHYNNIYNNTNYGVYSNYYYYAANATYNWWGSVNGPGQDGANGVSGAVIYEPWLTEPWSGGVGLTQHDPIYINGNEDFATQAENESWAGNGTEADPYIIENWDIDASTAHGIEIRNTDVYFIIRSCIIHDGWTGDLETSHNGIYFSSVTNGSIDNVYGYNNHRAIYLLWSSNNIITNSTLYNNNRDLNSAGIYLENSGNNIIRYSVCYNNANGIWLTGSNNQLFDCICYDNDDDGIIMAGYSKNNMVTNYISYNNNYGIRFWYTSHNLLMNYVAYNNYYGIYVHNSSNNVINLSTIYNSSWGIHIASYSNNNTIYHNNFINNTNNAYDGCSNYWDNGYPSGGNYWDDYTGSDANDDGIGDTPYPISGSGNYDYYPFMEPSGWEEVGLTPHAPIYINGDDDFASQAESEGWIGIGSATNPYIIENYDINAGTAHGIEIRNTNVYFIIRNCMIHDGKISEDGVYGNYGIFFHNVKNGTVDNITSYSNFVGIYMQSLSNNQLINCTVYNNSEGIYLYSASNNQIIKCTVYDNARGIWLDNYSANNQITNSTVYNNPYGISLYYSSNNKIVNCVVYNNGHGLWLYYSSDNQIAKCDVNNSFKNGIYLYYSSNNKIHYCNIYNNTDYGVYNYNSAVEYQVNATYNYWGSASGPGGVGPGNGDEVNYMVLYEPWLVVPWGVEDVVPPQICNIQAFPVSQEIYGYVNITCTITDNVAVNTAKVNVTGPAGFTSINATMTRIAGTNNYYYNITYSIPGKYSYYIFTMDTSNNGNKSAPYEFTIRDTAKPEITNIHGRPFAVANISTGHIVYWRVWISCGVTDNFAVSIVKVNITGPVGFTPINVTMTRYSAPPYTYEFYQYDATYLIAGTYSYYIWANDTSGNEKKSPEYHFTIPIAVAETIDGREVNVIGIGNGTVNIEPVALPQPPPENLQYIGIQVNVTITGTLTYANITIKYNESDATGIDEAMLRMYYWTGTEWRLCNNTGVNTANNIVWANVSHLTIFVPMAEKVIEAPAPPSNLFLYIGIAVIAAIIIVIFLVLMLAGIGITGVRVVKRRKIPRLQIVKCVYCQATTKITSPDRPLLFQCPKCGGKSVIR